MDGWTVLISSEERIDGALTNGWDGRGRHGHASSVKKLGGRIELSSRTSNYKLACQGLDGPFFFFLSPALSSQSAQKFWGGALNSLVGETGLAEKGLMAVWSPNNQEGQGYE
eukprot:1195109-Prorocentrum_minimum.AAC.2